MKPRAACDAMSRFSTHRPTSLRSPLLSVRAITLLARACSCIGVPQVAGLPRRRPCPLRGLRLLESAFLGVPAKRNDTRRTDPAALPMIAAAAAIVHHREAW